MLMDIETKKDYTKIDLYSMGHSVEEIAQIKGITVKEVRAWIRRNGIQRGTYNEEGKSKRKLRELISW
jgi:uncharacterized protein YjcR